MSPQVSGLYRDLHADVDFFAESSDLDRQAAAYELQSMLGLLRGGKDLFDFEQMNMPDASPFETYPNVLNNTHTSDAAWSRPAQAPLFRNLPCGGRRSPRSALFCYMAEDNGNLLHAPYAHRLWLGEGRSSSAEVDDRDTEVRRDELSSDSDVSDLLDDCTPEARAETLINELLCFTQDADGNHVDGVDELKLFIVSHFAARGSSRSAILNAHLSEFEDRCLAAEADEEAEDDLSKALQRLYDGIRKCVSVTPDSLSLPFLCNASDDQAAAGT
jgi:hypothetical protein